MNLRNKKEKKMAITKEAVIEKIEVVGSWNVQVATDTVIKEDGTEISRSRHRHVLQPCSSSKDSDDKWTHTDTDISGEASEVQAVANAVWTDTVKANYKTFVESQEV
tara:strand:- start:1848 stop:2168 length:321 start_codon:yes stop_codon:yes gene_type:complete